jgi:hypothetical protein
MPAFKDFYVDLTVHVSTRVTFSRESKEELEQISKVDAIDNAIGMLPTNFVEELEGNGFEVALPFDGVAYLERVS